MDGESAYLVSIASQSSLIRVRLAFLGGRATNARHMNQKRLDAFK